MSAVTEQQPKLSRREFHKLSLTTFVSLFFGPFLTACTAEIEKPLNITPPLIMTFKDQSVLFSQLPEQSRETIETILLQLSQFSDQYPSAMVDLKKPPFNWGLDKLPQPKGQLQARITVLSDGRCYVVVPSGSGSAHFVTDNKHAIYLPFDYAINGSLVNNCRLWADPYNHSVRQKITQSLDWLTIPQEERQDYPLLFATETRFFRINKQSSQSLLPPTCRAFLETAVSRDGIKPVDPDQFSNLPLHDLQTATQVLTTLLLASERYTLISNISGINQIPLFSPHQSPEVMAKVRLENVDPISFEARDPDLKKDIEDIEITFQATCFQLPKELPLAFTIAEQRTGDKGQIETRVRLVFMKNDGTISENWFFAPERKLHIGDMVLLEDLPNEIRVALNLSKQGFKPIGIEQAQTKLFWDGETYRVGVYNLSEKNQIVFEWDKALIIDDLAKAVIGARTGSINHNEFERQSLDLTEWYYLLRNQGISDVGPAGLTLPEWITKILHGIVPQDEQLTATLRDNDYFLPLFSKTPLAELDDLNDALLVYLGERTGLALTLKNGWDWRQFRTKAQIQSFDGELHFADMLPLWKKGVFANVPQIGDVPVLKIGGNLIEALSVPYDPGQYSVIKGDTLKKIRALFKNLTFLYNSQPKMSGAQIGKVPVFDPEQKKQRRQQLAAILKSLPQF